MTNWANNWATFCLHAKGDERGTKTLIKALKNDTRHILVNDVQQNDNNIICIKGVAKYSIRQNLGFMLKAISNFLKMDIEVFSTEMFMGISEHLRYNDGQTTVDETNWNDDVLESSTDGAISKKWSFTL